jgi:hypothetical protein
LRPVLGIVRSQPDLSPAITDHAPFAINPSYAVVATTTTISGDGRPGQLLTIFTPATVRLPRRSTRYRPYSKSDGSGLASSLVTLRLFR